MGSSVKILIVDDNEAVRGLIKRLVLPYGAQVCECADGSEAPAVFEEQSPDLVLMDIRMKNVDGITATRRIRSAHPEARIVMVTDFDDDALRDAARRAGASGYLLKDNLLDLFRLFEPANRNHK